MRAHDPHCIRVQPADEADLRGQPALLLDRDGVINERRLLLVRKWNQFHFKPTALDAFRLAAKHNVPVFIATNQERVGTGYVRLADLVDTHERMVAAIQRAGGRIDAVYACIHAPTPGCTCRKPHPGMLLAAERDYGVDLSRSWMIGDNAKDMRAGRTAGTHTALVDPRFRTLVQRARKHADHVAGNLYEATVHALQAMGHLKPQMPP